MKKIKPLGVKTASAAMASVVTLGTVPFVMAPAANAQGQCTPIHVVTTLGTGGSWSDKSTDPVEGVAPNYNITQELKDQFGANQVSGWNTNYPASVGAVSMFWGLLGMPGGKEQVSFGKSIQAGVQKTDAHISQYKSACPNSKFVIIGYSQGASVAGDVARDISAGKVAGVSPDDVTNVLLIADPGRSSNSAYESYTGTPSKLYGSIPPGVMGKNFEIISPGSDARADRIGWTGERPGRFEGMYGKVLSLCAEDDLACSAPPNSFLRSLADYAMVETQIARFDSSLGDRIQAAVNHFTNNGGIQAAQAMDIPKIQQLLAESAVKANLTIADIPAGIALVKEISDLFKKIKNECGGFDLGDTIKSVFVYLIPTLVKNNLNVGGLQALWNQIPGEFKAMANAALKTAVAGASAAFTGPAAVVVAPILSALTSVDAIFRIANLPGAKQVINFLLGQINNIILTPIYNWVGKALGMDPKNNDLTSFGQQIAFLAGFPIAHGSYWNSTEINGQTAADYGRNWIKESVGNALAGKSYTASPKGKNLTDANLEQTLESQTGADGKVICNPKDLKTGVDANKGDTVATEEQKPDYANTGEGGQSNSGEQSTTPSTGESTPGSEAPSSDIDNSATDTPSSDVDDPTTDTPSTGNEGGVSTSDKPIVTSEPASPSTSSSNDQGDVNGAGFGNGNGTGSGTGDGEVISPSSTSVITPAAPTTSVTPTTVSEGVDASVVNNAESSAQDEAKRGLLATTGANVLGLLALASGLILLAAAVITSRRRV